MNISFQQQLSHAHTKGAPGLHTLALKVCMKQQRPLSNKKIMKGCFILSFNKVCRYWSILSQKHCTTTFHLKNFSSYIKFLHNCELSSVSKSST